MARAAIDLFDADCPATEHAGPTVSHLTLFLGRLHGYHRMSSLDVRELLSRLVALGIRAYCAPPARPAVPPNARPDVDVHAAA